MTSGLALTDTDIRNWVSSSGTLFDIAVCADRDLPDGVRIVGAAEIDADMKTAFSDRYGAFPVHKTQRLLQRAGARMSGRFAGARSDEFGVSADGLRLAWFHAIYSELTTLSPIRQLARWYARTSAGQIFAIRVGSTSFGALNGWLANEVEPLYLAHELRKLNIPVFLLFANDLDAPAFSFRLSGKWLPKGYPRFFHDADFGNVVVKNAMRRSGSIGPTDHARQQRRPGVLSRLSSYRALSRKSSVTVALRGGPDLGGKPTFSAPGGPLSLDQAFVDLMGPMTRSAADWFRSELSGKRVRTAHIADHASLEGGLLRAEVVRQGGEIHIWPHSANVVHIDAHAKRGVSNITMALRSTAQHWARKFGPDKVDIDPGVILPAAASISEFDPGHPLTVVLFAGAHVLRRVPFFSYEGHTRTWERALAVLGLSEVELLLKHKSSWETRDWIAEKAEDAGRLQFTNTHANDLKRPNMVFACVSLTSTALIEGIARGVPGFVIRDVPVDETPRYDADAIPIVRTSELEHFLKGLSSTEGWTALRDRQQRWLSSETAR